MLTKTLLKKMYQKEQINIAFLLKLLIACNSRTST